MQSKDTLVVNLLAGPGTGKSTVAAGVFNKLKYEGVNSELVVEFAKELTWEERKLALSNQIHVFGEQHHRVFRVLGKVDVVITDSPMILSAIYDAEKRQSLYDLVFLEHRKLWTYNVFLKRMKPYNPKGRNQSESEAKKIDIQIAELLCDEGIPFETATGNPSGERKIVRQILKLLKYEGK